MSPVTLLPTPLEMMAHLDRFVRGQQRAKRDLASAVYNHYLGVGYREEQLRNGTATTNAEFDFGKQHVLLMGPTGSGKTYMVRLLADFLQLPYCFFRANALVRTGYTGVSIEQLMGSVYRRAGNDIIQAQRAMVFLDEIDKIRCQSTNGEIDVSGESVQQMLLPVLDGVTVNAYGDRAATAEASFDIDTTGMLFVGTGAFVGLDNVVQRRLRGGGVMGFATAEDPSANTVPSTASAYARAIPEDLVDYGFIPEFVGRFATFTHVDELSVEDLIAILAHTDGSILPKQQRLFALHGIELTFTEDALQQVAFEANAAGTGARGLARILMRCLDDVDYRLPELAAEGVCAVTVTGEVVDGRAVPTLATGKRSDETEAEHLRASVFLRRPPMASGVAATPPSTFTDARGWSTEQILVRLDQVKAELDWENTTGSARKWWEAFESENQHRLALVLRLAEELLVRKATISEFFLAYVYSNTDNIQANLHYLDYTRLKKVEERKRRASGGDDKGDGKTDGE